MKPEWQEKIFPGGIEGAEIRFLDRKLHVEWDSYRQQATVYLTTQFPAKTEHHALPTLLGMVNKLKSEIEEAIDANNQTKD